MEINYDSYLKDNLFFAEEILFNGSGKKISQNEIDEMDDFPGKEDFAQFYLAHNGGCFRRARFYPEECYTDSINGYSYVEMDLFLTIPVDGDEEHLTIETWKDIIDLSNPNYEDFILFHIPFAIDGAQNTFWIDIQTGEIKYTDRDECLNPDEDAITVASSFKNFCKRIKKFDINSIIGK